MLAQLRLATEADLPTINEIYNHYVLHSTCTYQEEPSTPQERMKDCNVKAKGMKGDERKNFMSTCLKGQ